MSAPDHDPLASLIIDAELARLILGQRGRPRPELRVDVVGQLARMSIAYRFLVRDLAELLMPALRQAVDGIARVVRAIEADR